MEVKDGKAYQYAKWCTEENEGKIPEYVKKQAESWLRIVLLTRRRTTRSASF